MTRRGLTLIETLAAAVLLALIAESTLPVFVNASIAGDANEVADLDRLGMLADRIMVDPHKYGLDLDDLITSGEAVIEPTDANGLGGPIRALVLRSGDPEIRHAWVRLSIGDTHVYRWLTLPEASEGDVP